MKFLVKLGPWIFLVLTFSIRTPPSDINTKHEAARKFAQIFSARSHAQPAIFALRQQNSFLAFEASQHGNSRWGDILLTD